MAYEGERVVKSTGSYIYRMLTPDSIVPDPTDPQSFNRYSYVRNNPVNFTDPSGHCGADIANTPNVQPGQMDSNLFSQCVTIRDELQGRYGVVIEGIWKLIEMQALQSAFIDIESGFTSLEHAQTIYRGTRITRLYEAGAPEVSIPANQVKVRNGTFTQKGGKDAAHFVLLHELMHRMDLVHDLTASARYERLTGGDTVIAGTNTGCPIELATLGGACSYDPGPGLVSDYADTNRREDWADSAAASLYNGGNVNSIVGNQTNHGLFGSLNVDRGLAVQDVFNYSYKELFRNDGGSQSNTNVE